MKLCSDNQCTSCLACYNVCKFEAVILEKNSLGELKPRIDRNKCRECGQCSKVCPRLTNISLNRANHAIALVTKDEYDRKTCSSGGVATTLSRAVIRSGGVVFGAVIRNGKGFIADAQNEETLELLKGSKYTYCFPGTAYTHVKEVLNQGKQCMFIGTPCQVAGLRGYLGKQWDNLILVDLICHGTPPFEYIIQHLSCKGIDIEKVDQIRFRGADDFFLSVFDAEQHCLYKRYQNEDEYFTAFMRGLLFREICYSCPYAQDKRVSDITIGDFWGLSGGDIQRYPGKKSVALPNTDKGLSFLNDHLNNFYFEMRTVEEAVTGNDQLRKPSERSIKREEFVSAYERTQDFEYAMKKIKLKSFVQKMRMKNTILHFPRVIKRSLFRGEKRCE